MNMNGRLRAVALTVFCAYIGFVLAGLTFYLMVDDSPFVPLMGTYLELGAAWLVVAGGSAIALLAVVVGGLPIGLTILRQGIFTSLRIVTALGKSLWRDRIWTRTKAV